jgi:hypothetical protein
VTRDYYGESRALGADLWEAGYKEWADKLDTAIQSGSTATEILMAIRWTLAQLTSSHLGLPDELSARAADLEREISNALK